MGLVPKQYEKQVFWAVAIVGGLVLFNIYNKGIRGAVSGAVSGIVGGAFDAAAGVVDGAYTALPEAIKPSSQNNIINRQVDKAVRALTGDDTQTLGGWIYDITH